MPSLRRGHFFVLPLEVFVYALPTPCVAEVKQGRLAIIGLSWGPRRSYAVVGRGRALCARAISIAASLLCATGCEDEAKTVLDLLHSLGVEDQDIRFDNFGG